MGIMRVLSLRNVAVIALFHLAWAAESASTTPTPDSSKVLAAQLGPYPVSVYEHVINTSRPDPLAPTPQLRRLLITIYRPFIDNFTCPIEHQSQVPYAPPVVLDALLQPLLSNTSSSDISSLFATVKLVNCSRSIPSSASSGPLLLFSPGYGGCHWGYASILQAAASSGYTVVAIDPTYEAAAILFPDGQVAYPSNATLQYDSNLDGENVLQAVRIADAVSVLDAIERGDVPGLANCSNSSSKSNSTSSHSTNQLRALMFGHSFGGSTAVNVAAIDSRVVAAANIDGPYYGPVANGTAPVRKPLLMMQSTALPPAAPGWPTFYSTYARGWKTWVRPANTVHYGFTDVPLLTDLLGLRGTVVPEELVGTVNSRRLQEIVWSYLTQFFAYTLNDTNSDLLNGPSAEFPDVEFIGHVEAGSR